MSERELVLRLDRVSTYSGRCGSSKTSRWTWGGRARLLAGGQRVGQVDDAAHRLGLVRPRSGRVELWGEDVTHHPASYRIGLGMAIVPENRRLFAPMTVLENLELGAYLFAGDLTKPLQRVYDLFPRLYERRSQSVGTLSGGEQQMLAMGRALMSRPRLLLMDEPSMGLAPALVEQNFEIIQQVNATGVAVLVVEQNASMALSVANRGYVLATGRIVLADDAAVLARSDDLNGRTWADRGQVSGAGV